jgi:DNA-binding HxlR family transcriptional regulator
MTRSFLILLLVVASANFIVGKSNYEGANSYHGYDRQVPSRRSYQDACGIARALDLVGERWSLLVVRELLLGPKRFTDLRQGLPQISPDVLAQRLRDQEAAGLVRRRDLAPPAASRVYELTARGRALEPVIVVLGRWGSSAPFAEGVEPRLGNDAAVIALKSLLDGAAARTLGDLEWSLRLGEDQYALRLVDGRLDATRGESPDPRTTIRTDSRTLAAVLWHGRRLADARRTGDLEISGDLAKAKALLRLFPLPAEAEA